MTEFRTRNTPQDPRPPDPPRVPSKVQQHFRDDSDINNIVARHMRGVGRNLSNIGQGGTRQPMFGDFSSSMHYHDMLNAVTDADNAFRRLPARLRSRFSNSPYQLLRFLEDPANYKEAVKLGLVKLREGDVMTAEGDVLHQEDLVRQAAEDKPAASPEAPKADPEANPTFSPPKAKK